MSVAWWCSSTPGQIWTWRYTPFIGVWVVAASFVGAYVVAHRRAGRPLDRVLTRRWCLGVLALFVVSEWPLGQLGVGYLATVGVARYVVYTFVAAPLLVSGLPTWMLDRWFPFGSRREAVLSAVTRWPFALIVFNVVLFGTHLPIVVDSLKTTQLGSFAVDVLHLGAALVWWWPAIRRERARGAIQEPIRAFYLFASSLLMFVPAAFLTFSPLPLYGLYELAPPLWLGFNPIADQQAAGIVMNVIGGFVLWGIIAGLFLAWSREQEAADDLTRRDRDTRTLARMELLRSQSTPDTRRTSDAAAGGAQRLRSAPRSLVLSSPRQEQSVEADPSGIANDRAVVSRLEDDSAVLAVGPGKTPMHLPADELPHGATTGTWLVLDMQLSPPMVLSIDATMTAERSGRA